MIYEMSKDREAMLRERQNEMLLHDPRSLSQEGLILQGLALLSIQLGERLTPADLIGDVEKFHKKFAIDYEGPPRLLPPDLQKFRSGTIKEELKEYLDAVDAKDPEGQLDALMDLVYFALGTVRLNGWNGREAWRRVQVANMAKVKAEKAADSKRGFGDDVIKPDGWVAPDHKDLV